MDQLFIVLGLILCITGLLGSFIPIIPGPITSWFGLLVINFESSTELNYSFLLITLMIAIFVFALDIIIPIIGLKKFGGTKKGMIGATIGLLLGLIILGPLGILIGTFLGALSGEMTGDLKLGKAVKASVGTLIGFIAGVTMKFSISIIYFIFYLIEVKNIFLT